VISAGHIKRRKMNKPLAVGATTLTLLFGGVGVASASTLEAPASTTTTLAQAQDSQDDDNGDNGLWGLAGLLGLLGLAGLKRRKDADYPANRGAGTVGNPRA
jgi:MYXO-CTERM domain-containing protein